MTKNIAVTACKNYEKENVKTTLNQTIKLLGGLDAYIKPGKTVLLKVNLLMKKAPEAATTTHPAFVQALAELLIEYGCSVLIADSPGGPFTPKALQGVYDATGMTQIARACGATLNQNFKTAQRQNPQAKFMKTITICDYLNDADYVVSVSKLKTHMMMTFTGAAKNMFGVIPGLDKAAYHVNMPNYDDFAHALVDICETANPVLSFMDGIEGMEGDGPSAGDVRFVGAVLASASPHHLDSVACRLIGLNPKNVPTLKAAQERGLLCSDDTEILGEPLEKFNISPFKIPANNNFVLTRLVPALGPFVKTKPLFNHDTCVSCRICAENCPAHVIDMKNNKPSVRLEGCIRCYCCQELCPAKAVTVHRPLMLKLLTR